MAYGFRLPLLWLSAQTSVTPSPPPPPPPPVGLFHYQAVDTVELVELFRYEPLDVGVGGGVLFYYRSTEAAAPDPGTRLFNYVAHSGSSVDQDAPTFHYIAL